MSILMEDPTGSYRASFSRERLMEECANLEAENTELRKQVALKQLGLDSVNGPIMAELRKDKARLDWIIETKSRFGWAYRDLWVVCGGPNGWNTLSNDDNPREAIDVAMSIADAAMKGTK